MEDQDVRRYLNRLGIRNHPGTSIQALKLLHTAHVERVAHENLSIHIGESRSIDPLQAAKDIIGGRGGCCHHLNGAFFELLNTLGFPATRHRGGIQPHGRMPSVADASHMALTVLCENQSWYVDVGMGDALYEPIPLVPGTYVQGPFQYHLRTSTTEAGGWRFEHDRRGAFVGMDFACHSAVTDHFLQKDKELSSSPGSRFTQLVTVTRRDAEGVDELVNCSLSRLDASGRSITTLNSRKEWFRALGDVFLLDMSQLSIDEAEKLYQIAASREAGGSARGTLEKIKPTISSRVRPQALTPPETEPLQSSSLQVPAGARRLISVLQSIDREGVANGEVPSIATLLDGYRRMVLARALNDKAFDLVKQGKLGVYASSTGQEACQVACTTALQEQDWLFPTYRDSAAVIARGVRPAEVLSTQRGDWHCGYDPKSHRIAPQVNSLATQLPHAVGLAHASALSGDSVVAMALCGDGATSAGDFHEACNLAGVFKAPVVFFIQNNKYAISVRSDQQTAAASLAIRADGYGIPGLRVDGNDFAALHIVLSDAVARARAGEGPTVVEADTYRMGPHTSTDDPKRYRSHVESEVWRSYDPISRLRAYLLLNELCDEELLSRHDTAARTAAGDAESELSGRHTPNPDDMFSFAYQDLTLQLQEQRSNLRAEIALEDER
ncbi:MULTISPECIES: thiamine pyrophosphate-dependent enzyme [unclassified Pseudonocardia]|uniref:thiamine pyrophosphate-dependent enzyme n=1 Tax=unclassified Pseudonocardia TaxID=2619320 RepID=UPI00158C0C34|nr:MULTISPECIES: thiamine pyrophosphate-dependent enzyme [unclassified Pseudonocardia]